MHGLGTEDDPVWLGMHDASAAIAGASVAAADAVRSGRALHAVNIAGGLHHAHKARAAGFCVYNDPAIAIRALLDDGVRRIAYIDVDAHHGDGVQEAFYDDDRVLTVSLHQSGTTLFPGTGFPEELGTGDAEGTSVNVALPGFTGDAGWLRAFSGVVPVLVRAFEPEILVTQCGCDGHRADPLTDLRLTVDGQRAAYVLLHDLAHEVCGGRWLATRRRRLRAGRRRPAGLDAPARGCDGKADRSGHGDAAVVAGARAVAGGGNGAGVDDRRSRCPAAMLHFRPAWIPVIRSTARSCEPGVPCFRRTGYFRSYLRGAAPVPPGTHVTCCFLLFAENRQT